LAGSSPSPRTFTSRAHQLWPHHPSYTLPLSDMALQATTKQVWVVTKLTTSMQGKNLVPQATQLLAWSTTTKLPHPQERPTRLPSLSTRRQQFISSMEKRLRKEVIRKRLQVVVKMTVCPKSISIPHTETNFDSTMIF
jgi:hypothetical protein